MLVKLVIITCYYQLAQTIQFQPYSSSLDCSLLIISVRLIWEKNWEKLDVENNPQKTGTFVKEIFNLFQNLDANAKKFVIKKIEEITKLETDKIKKILEQ